MIAAQLFAQLYLKPVTQPKLCAGVLCLMQYMGAYLGRSAHDLFAGANIPAFQV